jgi:hypothetical protein
MPLRSPSENAYAVYVNSRDPLLRSPPENEHERVFNRSGLEPRDPAQGPSIDPAHSRLTSGVRMPITEVARNASGAFEECGGAPLRIGVDQKNSVAPHAQALRQGHSRRCLRHSSFEVGRDQRDCFASIRAQLRFAKVLGPPAQLGQTEDTAPACRGEGAGWQIAFLGPVIDLFVVQAHNRAELRCVEDWGRFDGRRRQHCRTNPIDYLAAAPVDVRESVDRDWLPPSKSKFVVARLHVHAIFLS